jgi:hypothetical protein
MKKITIYIILVLGLVGLFLLGYNSIATAHIGPPSDKFVPVVSNESLTLQELEEINSNLKEMIGLLGRLNDCCRSCNR